VSDPDSLLTFVGVTKRYPSGDGLRGLDLEVRAGQVHAIVGMNGAGKSTLMRVALGMTRSDGGELRVLGRPVDRLDAAHWRRVGHAVDGVESYPELTVRENLLLSARLHGVPRADAGRAVDRALAELDLAELRDRRARELSAGNRLRTRVAAALVHDPDLLLLDEPTASLDPAGVLRVRGLLAERARAGAGVLVSSHHLDEVARIADVITVVSRGRAIGRLDPGGVDIERAFFRRVHADMESS
jgi:ABC-2 type transport system ATP-binding protein